MYICRKQKPQTMEEVLLKICVYLFYGIILVVGGVGITACFILFVVQFFRCLIGKGEIKEKYTITINGRYQKDKKKKKS